MIALIQRVSEASVRVDGELVGEIGAGLLALIGVQQHDTDANAQRLAERVLGYRVFADDAGRMNRSLADCAGALLAVPQFTLAADTQKGTRPSFSSCAEPARARALFERFVECAAPLVRVQTGVFGADMRVALINSGPVTFTLHG